MRKPREKLIKKMLRNHLDNKKLLELPWVLTGNKSLSKRALFVLCFEEAVSTLPKDIQQYVQLRYFSADTQSLSDISMTLNVSERTLNRWDKTVLQQIAYNLDKYDLKQPWACTR